MSGEEDRRPEVARQRPPIRPQIPRRPSDANRRPLLAWYDKLRVNQEIKEEDDDVDHEAEVKQDPEVKEEEEDVKQEDGDVKQEQNEDDAHQEPIFSGRAEDAIREVIAQRRRDREAREAMEAQREREEEEATEARIQGWINSVPAFGPAPAPEPEFEAVADPEPVASLTVTRSGRVSRPSLKARERLDSEKEENKRRRLE
ncbi:hypothetical protein B0T20DRAFT_390486 [Sordaria brevicollis]|uniref:Uncharacterized protein n=1 Tax=Sordaria brevicollis TaxID=83679 RepID=A0AAE0PIN5_SORBR|nr:hypothetical protein B0T20DRAFT_390486 [Sordaria brevicollis]